MLYIDLSTLSYGARKEIECASAGRRDKREYLGSFDQDDLDFVSLFHLRRKFVNTAT